MHNWELKEFIREKYMKDKQNLNLIGHFVDEPPIYDQEVLFDDYNWFLEIRTYDMCYFGERGYQPYYIKKDGFHCITVPKFGELTKEDIAKAIFYVLNQIDAWLIFNVTYNEERVWHPKIKDYELDGAELISRREWNGRRK